MNSEVLNKINTADIYITNCEFPGISKGLMESALLGKPIIHNLDNNHNPDRYGDWIVFVKTPKMDIPMQLKGL